MSGLQDYADKVNRTIEWKRATNFKKQTIEKSCITCKFCHYNGFWATCDLLAKIDRNHSGLDDCKLNVCDMHTEREAKE